MGDSCAAGAGSSSAPRVVRHHSGLWIGEAQPEPGSEHDVPVNPIKWSLSLCPGSGSPAMPVDWKRRTQAHSRPDTTPLANLFLSQDLGRCRRLAEAFSTTQVRQTAWNITK